MYRRVFCTFPAVYQHQGQLRFSLCTCEVSTGFLVLRLTLTATDESPLAPDPADAAASAESRT